MNGMKLMLGLALAFFVYVIFLKHIFTVIVLLNILSTQKQPGCKKGVALFKMVSVKKVVKSKGAAKKWL